MRPLFVGLAAGLLCLSASCPALAQRRSTTRPDRAATSPSTTGDVLASLRPGHPRLYLLDQDLPALKARVASEPTVKAWHVQLEREAERMLGQPPIVHRLIGPRLLDQSRRALDRIGTLALLYRIDGDRRWLDRARKELLTAAAFPDWNPSHFLDTAEMTHAMAIGYDWLYADLSGIDRATIRTAIVRKGLEPGLEVYRGRRWWVVATHNWNQVCNGGMTVGALALADEEPAIAREVINASRTSIARAMASFAPDGGWNEGPGYWSYATRYNVVYLDALGTALGTDFGLKALPGFAGTDRFWVHASGPAGYVFNYADCGERAGAAAQMLWFARTFHHPAFAAREATLAARRADAFHLVWSDVLPAKADHAEPLDAFFKGIDVAFFRSAWDDPKAAYLGFKGGDNKANHSHLDLGTFVLDADGKRWAIDLGGDDYNMPGYFGRQRWEYFRLNTQSHNTLTVDGRNQDSKARAPIVAFHSGPSRSFAVADLTAGYASQLQSARRGIALLDRKRVLVQDEVTARRPAEITWKMLTRAKVACDGARATLTQDRSTLRARILEPSDARFEVSDATPPPPQNPNKGVSALTVRVKAEEKPVRIVVLLEPGTGAAELPRAEPLEEWVAAGTPSGRP